MLRSASLLLLTLLTPACGAETPQPAHVEHRDPNMRYQKFCFDGVDPEPDPKQPETRVQACNQLASLIAPIAFEAALFGCEHLHDADLCSALRVSASVSSPAPSAAKLQHGFELISSACENGVTDESGVDGTVDACDQAADYFYFLPDRDSPEREAQKLHYETKAYLLGQVDERDVIASKITVTPEMDALAQANMAKHNRALEAVQRRQEALAEANRAEAREAREAAEREAREDAADRARVWAAVGSALVQVGRQLEPNGGSTGGGSAHGASPSPASQPAGDICESTPGSCWWHPSGHACPTYPSRAQCEQDYKGCVQSSGSAAPAC